MQHLKVVWDTFVMVFGSKIFVTGGYDSLTLVTNTPTQGYFLDFITWTEQNTSFLGTDRHDVCSCFSVAIRDSGWLHSLPDSLYKPLWMVTFGHILALCHLIQPQPIVLGGFIWAILFNVDHYQWGYTRWFVLEF